MLFHFNASWMPGGFAGVDVFFVISGFLMTGIIFRGIEQENFSILTFYIARANRIIPALAVLCFVLLVFGWFYLAPLDYRALGKHIGSSIGLFSNIVYWRELGYFEAGSHEKWLIHTWSLSAECQFYIVYPIVLVAMRKFMSLKAMKASVLLGAVLGFIFCVAVTYRWPTSAYYLLPTRVWEMMFGGVACLYPFNLDDNKKKFLEWLGLILIVGSYCFFSKETPWPGYLALFSVFGSFLILQAQRNDSVITSNIVFQKIGAWSYSIYLWHWPLVAAIYYFSLNDIFIYLGIALSVLLGFLSNKYIEKIKFRSDFGDLFGWLRSKPVRMALFGGVTGSVIYVNGGFEARNTEAALAQSVKMSEHYEFCFENVRSYSTEYCVFHVGGTYDRNITANIDVILLGDSHASSLVTSILESMRNNNKIGDLLFYGHPGCLPLFDEIYKTEHLKSCNYRNSAMIGLINKVKNDKTKIVIINRPSLYLYGQNEESDNTFKFVHYMTKNQDIKRNKDYVLKSYNKQIDEIKKTSNTYILLPIPEQKIHIPKTVSKNLMLYGHNSYEGIALESYMDRNKLIRENFYRIDGVKLIEPIVKLCNKTTCKALHNNKPLYYDDNHLSVFGAYYISGIFDGMWN